MHRGNNPLMAHALSSPRALTNTRGEGRTNRGNEPVAAPEFRTDEIAVRAECFAQGEDLNLEVLFRHNNVRPHPVEKLLLGEKRAIGLQQGQKEVEGASAELDRNPVGEQAPPEQQHAETSEFES